MASISLIGAHAFAQTSLASSRRPPLAYTSLPLRRCFGFHDCFSAAPRRSPVLASADVGVADFTPTRSSTHIVGDFMTKKEKLLVVKTTTSVDDALQLLVEKRITGLPVIDDDWNLVGVISDYDLLALDTISGWGHHDIDIFPDVDSSWKEFDIDIYYPKASFVQHVHKENTNFFEIQRLLSKANGEIVGDLMTPAPLVVRETTKLEDAARLLLETQHHRLPVVDNDGKLVGIITRGNVVKAALQIKRYRENLI